VGTVTKSSDAHRFWFWCRMIVAALRRLAPRVGLIYRRLGQIFFAPSRRDGWVRRIVGRFLLIRAVTVGERNFRSNGQTDSQGGGILTLPPMAHQMVGGGSRPIVHLPSGVRGWSIRTRRVPARFASPSGGRDRMHPLTDARIYLPPNVWWVGSKTQR
jgi:hypothetical protein